MIDNNAAAALLDADPDFRVLRRLEVSLIPVSPPGEMTRRAVFLDTETTGTDVLQDQVIELAMVAFDYDPASGAVHKVYEEEAFNRFRDPGRPIPPEATRVNNITDDMVAGQTISDEEVEAFLEGVGLVIAHSASFDRPMVEKTWPVFQGLNWACSIEDLGWKERGFASNSLEYLVMKQGYFFEGHRAKIDCLAGIAVLAATLPTGEKVLAGLLDSARKARTLVRAVNSPFETKDILRARGYRWDAADRVWWTLTEDLEAEQAWLADHVYGGRLPPLPLAPVRADNRFSLRVG
ncbi:3'-5' exonuclease [Hwanghaeella sp.]|uniref:3'-5' exonuclease n=1 Tax=Hwanghaeella sp. TaxID=2605943 RepID=UPI003CCBF64E